MLVFISVDIYLVLLLYVTTDQYDISLNSESDLQKSGRTPCTGHRPVARSLLMQGTQTRKEAGIHPCSEWGMNQ
jgi:hypothetical protein